MDRGAESNAPALEEGRVSDEYDIGGNEPPKKRPRLSPSPSTSQSPDPPPFYIDTQPAPYLGTQHLYDYVSTPETATTLPVLGEPLDPPAPHLSSGGRACFNCGSPDHVSGSCPLPRDPARIAENRLAFQEQTATAGEGGRLGALSERMRMMGFADRFKPGEVSDELREALGFGRGGYRGPAIVDYPWFWNMREWGYPPGWEIEIGSEETKDIVSRKIGRDLDWANVDLLNVYETRAEADADEQSPPDAVEDNVLHEFISPPPLPPTSPPPPPPPPSDPPPASLFNPTIPMTTKRRLVDYHTTLFNSNLLPTYQPNRRLFISYPSQPFSGSPKLNHIPQIAVPATVTVPPSVPAEQGGSPSSEMDMSSGDEL
ncbi:hypothetical protein T439DRAFT_216916 [Meredithblackwellia eburnea MCA 4105]